MKKISFYYVFMLALGLLVFSCSKDDDPKTPETDVPTIASVTPGEGAIGTSVTIKGANFATTASGNVVKFNGTTATVTDANATQIITSVPSGATTGKITVKVGSNTATSPTDFTVLTGPSIVLDQTELSMKTLDTATLSITNSDAFGDETVTWSSDNETSVLVDGVGNLKAVGGGTATITASIGNLSATATVTVSAYTFTAGEDNYMPKIWRGGGEWYSLEMDGASEGVAHALTIDKNGDLYAVGSVYDSGEFPGISVAVLWKNGVIQEYLASSYSEAFDIAINENGDILIAGYYNDVNDHQIGMVLRNGSVLYALDKNEGDAVLNAIAVDEEEGTVYAVGHEGYGAVLMVDGVAQVISGNNGYVYAAGKDVFIKDSDVYVAGHDNGEAVLWKNEVAQTLPKDLGSAYAESVHLAENGDEYVIGHESSESSKNGLLWKNGQKVPLTDADDALLMSVGFAYDEVFFAGYFDKADAEAAFWLGDGEANILAGGNGSNARAYDVIVK